MTQISNCSKRLFGGVFSFLKFSGGEIKCGVLIVGFSVLSFPAFAQTNSRVLGTDVSYWQSEITQSGWNSSFSTHNRKFVQIRASRGGTTGQDQTSGTPGGGSGQSLSQRYDDPRFVQNVIRATAAGFIVGPYHFARPDVLINTGTDEADHAIQMSGAWMRPGYMMPMYDMEETSGDNNRLRQFAIDFSERLYAVLKIRPNIYINGLYSGLVDSGATAAQKDALAKPAAFTPSVVSPCFPMLWNARYSDNTATWTDIPVQTGDPKTTYSTVSAYYGPWDDYGNTEPWSFWQYASVANIGLGDATCDVNVSHGDMEYVRNYLVPAVWWNDFSGDWSVLTNWNSGQTPVAPVTPPDQTQPYSTGGLPTARLPGAAGSGPTSGQYDTVILERTNVNFTVTLSTGTHNVRKLYMRETLNITGGSLTINYNPAYRANDSTEVLHGGLISAQFSGPVTLSGGTLNLHTLQVDTNRIFTLGGGTLTFNRINLMPHSSAPAKILISSNVNLGPLANVTAIIVKGAGAGSSGSVDLGGASRSFNIGNGTNEVDLSIDVPVSNGGITKTGVGTMRLTIANTYSGGTTVTAGRLFVNNGAGSGTGTGTVTVDGGVLGGTGIIAGAVTVNSGGTIAPGTSIGTLTLNTPPTFSGTNLMEINRNGGSSLADKIVLTSGMLNYGGTLVVTNIGAALTGGEVFTNFTANSGIYSGAFANTILPALTNGLNWYLGHLTTNGTIKVNRHPIVNAVTVTNNFSGVLQIPIASLINGTDADGDALSLSSFGVTTNGVTLTADSTFLTYSNGVNMADKFNFIISDGHGGTATNTVTIVSTIVTGAFAQQPSANGSSTTLYFSGTPGATYFLDRSTNLPVWLTIWTNVAPPGGLFDYTDNFQDLSEPPSSAFYRLHW